MIPRRRGFRRKVERKRPIAAADCRRREVHVPIERKVEYRRKQHDAVDADVFLALQVVDEHRGARRTVRFAEEKLRRVPTPELCDVARDKLRERAHVGIDAVHVLFVCAVDASKARAGRVHKDEIGAIEQRVRIIAQFIRRVRRRLAFADFDAHRPERPHAQPNRRTARTAVVQKGDRPRRRILAINRKRGVEHIADRLIFVVLQIDRSGTRRILIRSSAKRDRMLRYGIGRHSGSRGRRRGIATAAASTSAKLSMTQRLRIPALEIVVETRQRRRMQIDHMPRFVEAESDVAP